MAHAILEGAQQVPEVDGKLLIDFGSFGWSGEAPRLVLEIMEHKFAMNVIKPPLLIKYLPDNAASTKCREFGKKIAEQLMSKYT
jgi:flavorubredoxin